MSARWEGGGTMLAQRREAERPSGVPRRLCIKNKTRKGLKRGGRGAAGG